MRFLWSMVGILAVLPGSLCSQAPQPIPATQLVREVVYNELHDHGGHGFWRYWIERHTPKGTRHEDQVETAEGPVTRLSLLDGRPPSPEIQQLEQARLARLLASPQEQARHRQDYAEEEKRIGKTLALFPDAFLYEYAGDENGCHRLHFRPNPAYPSYSIEARIFHAMSGDLWVNIRTKRLARLDGHLDENVDFGYGILGRLYKGGWFRLQRTQASATEWKTERLEVHMAGRAMLFKSIARETSELRGGFVSVPGSMSLAQAMALLDQTDASNVPVNPGGAGLRRLPESGSRPGQKCQTCPEIEQKSTSKD
jgi:hypothetical protein